MKPSITTTLAFIMLSLNSFGQGLENYKDIINIDDEFELLASNKHELRLEDLSHFWINNKTDRRFGFIGINYRRLRIKFLSIIKNNEDPTQYFVYGKSKVSDNICAFQGTITVRESHYIKGLESPNGNTGILAGEYKFYEDPKSKHSGVFEGRFVTYWYRDEQGTIKYNDLGNVSAMYNNNQFSGTWTGYGNRERMAANWGDGRIPQSGDLDVGTSEFGVNRKYQMNGWESLIKMMGGGNSKEEEEKAMKEEHRIWWKDE